MYRFRIKILIPLSFLVIVVGISACEGKSPFSCDAFKETILSTFPTTDTEPKTIRMWINTHYITATPSLKEGTDTLGRTWFYWSINQSDYRATVSKEGSGLNVYLTGKKPSLKDVVGCLGKPGFYEARVLPPTDTGFLTQVGLWYPVRKLYVSSTESGSNLVVNDSTTFDRISILDTESVRQMKLRPWPADLTDIHVEPWP